MNGGTSGDKLDELPSLPRDGEGPVFAEPWQAQAFAMTVKLHEAGWFAWGEWAACLAEEIKAAQAAGDPDLGDHVGVCQNFPESGQDGRPDAGPGGVGYSPGEGVGQAVDHRVQAVDLVAQLLALRLAVQSDGHGSLRLQVGKRTH